MEQWIRFNDDVEYSTDYNFFKEKQIYIAHSKNGTKFISRIDGRIFASTRKRNVSPKIACTIISSIHAGLCDLKYGGKLVS